MWDGIKMVCRPRAGWKSSDVHRFEHRSCLAKARAVPTTASISVFKWVLRCAFYGIVLVRVLIFDSVKVLGERCGILEPSNDRLEALLWRAASPAPPAQDHSLQGPSDVVQRLRQSPIRIRSSKSNISPRCSGASFTSHCGVGYANRRHAFCGSCRLHLCQRRCALLVYGHEALDPWAVVDACSLHKMPSSDSQISGILMLDRRILIPGIWKTAFLPANQQQSAPRFRVYASSYLYCENGETDGRI
jgi:hypothetical protein